MSNLQKQSAESSKWLQGPQGGGSGEMSVKGTNLCLQGECRRPGLQQGDSSPQTAGQYLPLPASFFPPPKPGSLQVSLGLGPSHQPHEIPGHWKSSLLSQT